MNHEIDTMNGFEKVCELNELTPGEAMKANTSIGPITLYHLDDGCFATQDQCSHGQWSLADGILEDGLIECPLHGGKFCVRTGAVKAFPPTIPLKTFPVQVHDGHVWVKLDGQQ